jgi:hypothetical protein
MEETIQALLPYGYEIHEADVQSAKNYILQRESAAHVLSSLIDALLKDAAARITEICYRYGIDAQRFTLTSKYNEKMFDEVAQALDQLEDEIMDLLLDYATRCTESEERKKAILPWLLLLGRDNRNLKQTLENRIRMFVKDIEAMVVSMSLAKYDLQKAVTKIKSNLHTVYVTPEVRSAFNKSVKMQATYIRSKGVKYGNVGSSNSEANNIIRFGEITVQMAWMRNLLLDYEEKEAVGFYVGRGSNFPCSSICDLHVGYHDISETEHFPPQHPACCCWAAPVYEKQ